MSTALHLAGALALLLSVALLVQRRIGQAAWTCAVQGALVAVATVAQGIATGAIPLAFAGMLALLLNGIALPLALRRAPPIGEAATDARVAPVLLAAVGVVALALVVSIRLDMDGRSEVLALGFAVMLLGLLRAGSEGSRAAPAIGLAAAQNGILLAASVVRDLPTLMLVAAALPLVPALLTAGLWFGPTSPQAGAAP